MPQCTLLKEVVDLLLNTVESVNQMLVVDEFKSGSNVFVTWAGGRGWRMIFARAVLTFGLRDSERHGNSHITNR
jgi:hypothetical protein